MRRIVLTYNDISEINQILKDKGLCFKVHLHDACNSQSFTIETLGECDADGPYDEMKQVISQYFAQKDIIIRFLDTNQEFVLVIPER